MKRYTLIVDGNYFLHKTLFISGRIKTKKQGPLNFIDDPEKDADLFAHKLATDFAYEVRRFAPVLDGVVYCIDSSSWRKDFYPDTSPFGKSSTYKGNRKKDNTINWKAIYDLHDKFAESLKSLGCTISRVSGAEADDLIFAWSSYLNMNDKNALIFSGDNDLIQLACENANGTNTIFYNKFSKKVYSPLGFTEWLAQTNDTTIDIFDQPLDLVSNIKVALQNVLKGLIIEEKDTQEFVFNKILVGDSGDNVSSLYQYKKTNKDGKTRVYNLTDNKAKKIREEYENKHGHINDSTFFNKESIRNICSISKNVCKIMDTTLPQLIEKYETNRNLMYLHNKAIPPSIMNVMLEEIETSKYSTIHNLSGINKENIVQPILNDEKNINQTEEASFFGGIKFE